MSGCGASIQKRCAHAEGSNRYHSAAATSVPLAPRASPPTLGREVMAGLSRIVRRASGDLVRSPRMAG
jgi:hypothetical protein